MTTESFPVLGLDVLDNGTVEIQVEDYTPDKPYVALSHVWADDLGNPHANALQSCQLAYLVSLLDKLPAPINSDDNSDDNSDGGSRIWSRQQARVDQRLREFPQASKRSAGRSLGNTPTKPPRRGAYRFWIDTLCCPISTRAKRRALERVVMVYGKASHVLVLDQSILSVDAKNDGLPAVSETCLRILASSTWMKRLWTMQEGNLATSLHF